MSAIDFRYIGASQLTQDLARCETIEDAKQVILDHIQEDLANARGYIDKYGNKWDRLEGTDVDPLRIELDNIRKLLCTTSK